MGKKRIGIVVAVETDAINDIVRRCVNGGRLSYKWMEYFGDDYDIVIVECGVGEINAAAATQYLISNHKADVVVNYGVVGSLNPEIIPGETVLVNAVVKHDFDVSAVDGVPRGWNYELKCVDIRVDKRTAYKQVASELSYLKEVKCASGNQFINSEIEKRNLREQFGADICDMESAGIAIVCKRNSVPCIIVKTVADSAGGGSKEYWEKKGMASDNCAVVLKRVLDVIGRRK